MLQIECLNDRIMLAGSPTNADLIYEQETGNVKLDATEAAGQILVNFVLINDSSAFRPENINALPDQLEGFPKSQTTVATLEEISWTDSLLFVFGPSWESRPGSGGTLDLGNVFPAGLNESQLSDLLNQSVYVGQVGSGVNPFDLIVIPSKQNTPPRFTSDSETTVVENSTTALAVTAIDDDQNTLTFAISGGADGALFNINPLTGVLDFVTAPDFENPGDTDGDNIYEVEVTVDDQDLAKVAQFMRIIVADEDEVAPKASIQEVMPDPRAMSVQGVVTVFSEPVTGVDASDFLLMHSTDTTEEILLESATVTSSDNASWNLGNLANQTRAAGVYELKLPSTTSGIADLAGNQLVEIVAPIRWVNGAGDANQDGKFDQVDLIQLLRTAKYRSGQPAKWSEGDFDGNGLFNQFDIILVQTTDPAHYLLGPFTASS